jgi:hypothetical protein
LFANQPRTSSKQNSAPQLQSFGLRLTPGKWLEQRQPPILKLRQFRAADPPAQEMRLNGLQSRLRRGGLTLVQLFEPLAPPRETDRTEVRVRARGDDIGEGEIEVPQRGEGGSQIARQLLERDTAIVVELTLSDR